MNAAKRQQFRWAKGSIQVALKLLIDILLEKKISIDTKIQAFIQLTRHVVHPLFLIQYLVFPILLALNYKLYAVNWAPITGILIYVLMGPATYLYMIRKIWGERWKDKARQYVFFIFFAPVYQLITPSRSSMQYSEARVSFYERRSLVS